MYISNEFIDDYTRFIDLGTQFLQNKTIGIVGISRDNEQTLKFNLDTLGKLLSPITKELSIFIYENDSVDSTKSTLAKYQANNIYFKNFNFHSEFLGSLKYSDNKNRSKERIQYIAQARSKCQEYIKNHYSYYDYIIVTDFNANSISTDGILNSFGWMSENEMIDAMSGFLFRKSTNQYGADTIYNHDSWPYRHTWWADLSYEYHEHPKDMYYDPMLWFYSWIPLIGSMPLQVNSAFGGLCIYKTDKYLLGDYGNEDSEHVVFHRSINIKTDYNFNLYANPSQIRLLIS